jgi:hypothetical protein
VRSWSCVGIQASSCCLEISISTFFYPDSPINLTITIISTIISTTLTPIIASPTLTSAAITLLLGSPRLASRSFPPEGRRGAEH